ncbi:MAG TPA: SUMF1/EgtB/PvdO family nonheme iron enzyme [Rhodocyclaceae bacterium]
MHKRPSPRSQFRHACRHTAAAALAVVALVAAPTATAAQNRIALVVGNADYLTAPLKNPQNDARDIAEKLKQVGFDVVLRENLKIRDIGGALREFRARLSPGDEALFFYAGHGLQVKGINYLPAVDAEIKTEEDLPFQSLNVNQVLEIMDDARTRLNLVFLDACRNNPYSRRFRSTAGGLAKINAPSGTLISFATRPGSIAADGEGRNGLFTEHLLQQMDVPNLPIESVLKRVVSGVKQATAGAQEPWLEGSIEGEFYFVSAPKAAPAATLAAAAPTLVVARDAEDALWAAIERAPKLGDYEIYLKTYPKGKYVALATSRMAMMREAHQARSDEEAAWAAAERTQSAAAYQAYLAKYPAGLFAPLAGARLDRLRVEESVAADDSRKREFEAWDSAQRERTPTALLAFLDRFPASEFAPPARALLGELKLIAALKPGQPFRDCPNCPELVIVPPGSFEMGDPDSGGGLSFVPFVGGSEGPRHTVTISQPFAAGRHEVTFAEWDACVADKACTHRPEDHGWGRDRRPVVGVSWVDAQQYLAWLSRRTGHSYRLLTEAEWEYAARAGAATSYPWGHAIGSKLANCKGCGSQWDNQQTAPVGSFAANAFGLHDVLGNASDWVEDCSVSGYEEAPTDGSARIKDGCGSRVLRGGALYDRVKNVNVFRRFSDGADDREMWYGFRVARNVTATDAARSAAKQ